MGAPAKLQVSEERSAAAAYQRANPLEAKLKKKTGEGGLARGQRLRGAHVRADAREAHTCPTCTCKRHESESGE